MFVTSTPRSGSTLLAHILSAHPEVAVAADPFLPLFRAFRDAALRHAGSDPPSELPLQDYYFADERLRAMDAVQDADLGLPFRGELDALRDALAGRMQQESVDLAPRVGEIAGTSFTELLTSGLRLVAAARGAEPGHWVGSKDVWTIEFFAPVARAFPDAKFIVLLRDPRAVVASMHAIERLDTSQVAHTLSYARHWRKYVAFVAHYEGLPLFSRRLLTITYEDLVLRPQETVRRLCDHLEIAFHPRMLDTRSFADPGRGGTWSGNSSFHDKVSGLSREQVDRWRDSLVPDALELVELVCGPDMTHAGYAPVGRRDPGLALAALRFLLRDRERAVNWRSDLGDPQLDHGSELFRRALLELDGDAEPVVVRRSFLFVDAFTLVRSSWKGSWAGITSFSR